LAFNVAKVAAQQAGLKGPRSLSKISLGQHNRYIAADLMGYCDGIYPLVMTNIAMV
jgi:hypothetical protein